MSVRAYRDPNGVVHQAARFDREARDINRTTVCEDTPDIRRAGYLFPDGRVLELTDATLTCLACLAYLANRDPAPQWWAA